jgi:tetratricopeptide (TPR) repeat protein
MKAERRHELKQNALDKVIAGAPDYWRKYGGVALLVILAILAGFMLVRYRLQSAQEAQRLAAENLARARTSISQLAQINLYPIPAQQRENYRKQFSDDARSAIDQVTGNADEPKLLAEATLARGDLNYALAQLEVGPATQPAGAADRKTLLSEAETAYNQVLNQYPDQKETVRAANFGLAAVYENQGQWDQAKQKYQQIIDDPNAAEAYKFQARFRLSQAQDWSQPVLLAAATQPSTTPAHSAIPFVTPPTTPAPASSSTRPTPTPVEL